MLGNQRLRVVVAIALVSVTVMAGQESIGATNVPTAAVTKGVRHAYVIGRGDELKIVDLTGGVVAATVETNARTTGLAVSPDDRTAYVINGWIGTISVVDTASAHLTKRIKINAQLDSAAISPDGVLLYVTASAGGQGLLLAVNTRSGTLYSVIQVGTTPTGLAVSPDGRRLYVSNNQSGSVAVLDAHTAVPVGTIPVAALPQQVAVSPDSSTTYVTHAGETPAANGMVTVIDNNTDKVVDEIEVGAGAWGLAVSSDGSQLYVSNPLDGTVSVVDTKTRSVRDSIALHAYGAVTAPHDHYVYLAVDQSTTVLDSDTNLVSAQLDLVGLAGHAFSATTVAVPAGQ
ncbi:MAG: beta-propeller fold lactonase family protein [Kutzneria sp.]|nr:beta-propeller fold lactonase family protein [Kutzneria sp.]MBV9844837.1 beta-propeller fold lactonase family protein [Kutzneria sp.]